MNLPEARNLTDPQSDNEHSVRITVLATLAAKDTGEGTAEVRRNAEVGATMIRRTQSVTPIFSVQTLRADRDPQFTAKHGIRDDIAATETVGANGISANRVASTASIRR